MCFGALVRSRRVLWSAVRKSNVRRRSEDGGGTESEVTKIGPEDGLRFNEGPGGSWTFRGAGLRHEDDENGGRPKDRGEEGGWAVVGGCGCGRKVDGRMEVC